MEQAKARSAFINPPLQENLPEQTAAVKSKECLLFINQLYDFLKNSIINVNKSRRRR